MESFSYKYPEMCLVEPLGDIHDDYRLMADYWLRGFRDAQRDEVYHRLLQRMYVLTANARHDYDVNHNPYLTYVSRRVRPAAAQYDMMTDTLQTRLEAFVADVALLDLEPELTRRKRQAELYGKHQQMVNDMFDYIWTSGQWKDNVADTLQQIALSPTVDAMDQQLIVTATMLGAVNQFDINKLRMLVNVYLCSTDTQLRQRALVGWVFALDADFARLYPEERELVEKALADPRTCDELAELQIQILYCMSAEQDNQTIQTHIMPTLLKHNNLHITSHGIEETDDNRMQDMLHPEISERNMEKVEESFKKMMDMQKAGSDIYFGGFSQMKRFPFFDSLSNWFVPFYPEHPGIGSLMSHEGTGQFVRNVVTRVPFCNSDKYSFVLAFQQVADRIPANMREMMEHGGLPIDSQAFGEADKQSPAYQRRIYLQDLYRFYRLYPSRSIFVNPFDAGESDRYAFFADSLFCGTPLEHKFGEIVGSLMKRRIYAVAERVLYHYSEETKDYQYYMYCGHLLSKIAGSLFVGIFPSECFTKALSLRPDDVKARACQARAYFYEGRYTDAADAYSLLVEASPDNRNYILAYGVCLTNLEMYDKALSLLYRLNYERPDDTEVNRVLARALTGSGKYEQAMKIYDTLLSPDCQDGQEYEDFINCGYCEWLSGHIEGAVHRFLDYIRQRFPKVGADRVAVHCQEDIIESDKAFLLNHGITEVEMELMIDSVVDAFLG